MAILGTLVDISRTSRVGDGLIGQTFVSMIHSLPATNPESVVPVMRSMQANMGQNPLLFAIGGNASAVTVGVNMGSAVSALGSCPTIQFDMISTVYHSLVR